MGRHVLWLIVAVILAAACVPGKGDASVLVPVSTLPATSGATVSEAAPPVSVETGKFTLTITPAQPASLVPGPISSATPTLPTSPPSQLINHAELTLTLGLVKDTFSLGEQVSVTLQLQNIGTESVLVHTRMGMGNPDLPKPLRDIVFEITNPSGKELLFRGYVDLAASQPSDFLTLKPGESFRVPYYLVHFYNFDSPGRYSIKAIYNNQFDLKTGETAWKGEITSNTMTFTIEP